MRSSQRDLVQLSMTGERQKAIGASILIVMLSQLELPPISEMNPSKSSIWSIRGSIISRDHSMARVRVASCRQIGWFSTPMIQELVGQRSSAFVGLGRAEILHAQMLQSESTSDRHQIGRQIFKSSRNPAHKHIHATVQLQKPLSRCC
jgi:hypothetical protein